MAGTIQDINYLEKFDETIFPSWRYGFQMLLERNKLTTLVDGSEEQPEDIRSRSSTLKLYAKSDSTRSTTIR